MKHLRILILIPLTLLLTGSVTQQHLMVVARKNVVSGWTQTFVTSGDADQAVGGPTTNYAAFEFIPTNTGTVTSVTFWAKSNGTPGSNTFDVEIWTDSASSPSAVISGATVQFNQSSLTGSYAEYTLTLGTPASVTASTSYYVVFRADQESSFDFIHIHRDTTGGSGWDIHGSGDEPPVSWGTTDFDGYMRGGISGQ